MNQHILVEALQVSARVIGRLKFEVNKISEVARAEESPGSDHGCYLSPANNCSEKSSSRCQHQGRNQCSTQRVEAGANNCIGQFTPKRGVEEKYPAEQCKKE